MSRWIRLDAVDRLIQRWISGPGPDTDRQGRSASSRLRPLRSARIRRDGSNPAMSPADRSGDLADKIDGDLLGLGGLLKEEQGS